MHFEARNSCFKNCLAQQKRAECLEQASAETLSSRVLNLYSESQDKLMKRKSEATTF